MILRTVLVAVVAAIACAAPPARAQTLEQMAGQMILLGFRGDSSDDASVAAIRADLAEGTIGGVMYLGVNIASLTAVRRMNAGFKEAASELPPLIAIDQEGGAVERLTNAVGFPEVPRAATVAARMTPADAETTIYAGMARRLADLGFTVNFGPVVDLNLNPNNPIIARFGRAFGANPDIVAAYASAFIDAHHAVGMLTALKHFPGHGSSTADSHEGFVDITRTWRDAGLAPYGWLIENGYRDLVMVGHLHHDDYAEAGRGNAPATLSAAWVTGVLRDQLGFEGVVISDDLDMGAIREHFSLKEAVVAAVRAGVDILLFSNTASPYRPDLAEQVRAIMVAEAEADPAFRVLIEASYARIATLKARISQ